MKGSDQIELAPAQQLDNEESRHLIMVYKLTKLHELL